MERNYIAFVSYRHLPLDMDTAKRLHRRIEHYVIPKDLRRDGRKKLGLVFRDQDELPTSSNLSNNITEALDRSEFLIVICTPESAKSLWVQREIAYFLEHHDRDHVLAVLADGTPETAFPPQLTELRSPKGDLLDRIEPLAANIVADSDRKRRRLFRVESLRILAALIGCPFDALYRRELRYRRRRTTAAISISALVAAAFIGMLLNRNAEIREQLTRAQISESRTLAALSEQAYREGDYSGALRYALRALPGEGRDRPYVAEAEYALSRELSLYRQGELCYVRSVEQDTMISALALSGDGRVLTTADKYGALRFRDMESGELIRQLDDTGVLLLRSCDPGDTVLSLGREGAALYDAAAGEILWRRPEIGMLDLPAVSADGTTGLVTGFLSETAETEEVVSLMDLSNGQNLTTARLSDGPARFCPAAALTDNTEAAALLLQRNDGQAADLFLLHTGSGEVMELDTGIPYSAGAVDFRLLFTEEGDLLMACDNLRGQSFLRLYEKSADGWAVRYETPIETEKVTLETGGAASPFAGVDLFGCEDGRVVFGSRHELCMLRLKDGEILWQRTLPGLLVTGKIYSNACMGLVLDNGTVSFCSDTGYLSSSLGISSLESGYTLVRAAITGNSFPESSVVLVSEDSSQRAALVRFADNPSMIPVGAFSAAVSHVSLISSPGGKLVLALGYDPTGAPVEAFLLDAEKGESRQSFPLPSGGGWEDPGKLTLTDEGMLLSPECVLDVRTQTMTPPAEEEKNRPVLQEAEGTIRAAGENASRTAVWDGEKLTILNSESREELDAGVLPPATVKLLFACNDELLFSFSEIGTICIFRTSDGTLLYSGRHDALGLQFRDSGARYTVVPAANENRLLLFYDDVAEDRTVCLVFDRETGDCVGAFDHVAAYLPERDCVLVCEPLDGVYLSPFRSSGEIIALAAQQAGEA